ncbi:uncharacterized protein ASCRUDRAFT_141073, partial [Ascoidea rubescens DSM 1968]
MKQILKPRHIVMITIGGTFDAGIFLNSGEALANGGPASLFISYVIVAIVIYFVMSALSKTATYTEGKDGIIGYATIYVDRCLGFSIGYLLLFRYLIASPYLLSELSTMLRNYNKEDTSYTAAAWLSGSFILFIVVFVFSTMAFAEVEYILSCLKIIIIIVSLGSLIKSISSDSPDSAKGFAYWRDNSFKEYGAQGPRGIFFGIFSSLNNATNAFSGIELIAMTFPELISSGEIPRAILNTYFKTSVLYILLIFFMVTSVSSKNPDLINNPSVFACDSSPFSMVVDLSEFVRASTVLFTFSEAFSDLYFSSRLLLYLSTNGFAPAIFSKTSR